MALKTAKNIPCFPGVWQQDIAQAPTLDGGAGFHDHWGTTGFGTGVLGTGPATSQNLGHFRDDPPIIKPVTWQRKVIIYVDVCV